MSLQQILKLQLQSYINNIIIIVHFFIIKFLVEGVFKKIENVKKSYHYMIFYFFLFINRMRLIKN